jgi:hypothetical protein
VRHGVDQLIELYNLATDASETNDIAATNPDLVKRFVEYLQTARTDNPNYPLQ